MKKTAKNDIYLVGTGSANITPQIPMPMACFSDRGDKKHERVASDLYVKILAITENKKKNPGQLIFITIDMAYFHSFLVEPIRKKLSKKLGLQSDAIIFNASHTHSGPEMCSIDQNNEQEPVTMYDKAYGNKVIADIVNAVISAYENQVEAKLYFGKGYFAELTNRRGIDRQGNFMRAINQYGPIDHEIAIIKAVDLKDKVIAVVFNIGCHTTVMATMSISGDFPAFAREELEKKYQGATGLFMQGCGGQIKIPIRKKERYRFEYSDEYYSQVIGKKLAKAVIKGLESKMNPIAGSIITKKKIIELPLMEPLSQEELNEKPFNKPYRKMALLAKQMLRSMDENGNYKNSIDYQIMTASIGDDFRFILLSGEPSVSYGLRLKGRLLDKSVMVAGWGGNSCNKSRKNRQGGPIETAYLPSFDMLPAGGYEARSGVSLEAEEFVMHAVMQMLDENKVKLDLGYYYGDYIIDKYDYVKGELVEDTGAGDPKMKFV